MTHDQGNTSSRRATVSTRIPGGLYHDREEQTLTAEVEITVDWYYLFTDLGERAVRSARGRSRVLNGAVKARVIKPGK